MAAFDGVVLSIGNFWQREEGVSEVCIELPTENGKLEIKILPDTNELVVLRNGDECVYSELLS
jgi:hypothetical protein